MPGDYSRNSDQSHKRFSALFMQQGRVQLDADWNESVAILRRRIREEANDVFGAAAVPRQTTPDGFLIAWTGSGSTADITISSGRIYVDGLLAEYFSDEKYTYLTQPFLPNPPSPAGVKGNILVYLDVWEREITALEDPSIVDPALNGVDTGTRLKTIWQVKFAPVKGSGSSACVSDFSSMFPPSGGRLTTSTVPAAQAANPCELPASGGYQGIDNRFYRVQVHDATNYLVKWSRDNGSIATSVTAINNGSSSSTITVASTGADDDLSFHVNDWVEVTDDAHELNGQAGLMANVSGVNAAQRTITLDRPLTSGNFNPASNTVRVRRWDQTQGLYQNTGLVQVTPGTTFTLENGIQAKLDVVSGQSLQVGDAWVFAARVATGNVDILTSAPPIAVRHHYASLGTFSGLGGATPPTFSDCRVLWPPMGQGEDCACTVCVDAADHNAGTATIQQAINTVIKGGGGAVCLGPGTFNLATALTVAGASGVTIRGLGSATVLASTAQAAIAVVGSVWTTISDVTITCAPTQSTGPIVGVGFTNCILAAVERAAVFVQTPANSKGAFGVAVGMTGVLADITVRMNEAASDYGVLLLDVQERAGLAPDQAKYAGKGAVSNLRVEDNLFYATTWGVAIGGTVAAEAVSIARNVITSAVGGIAFSGAAVTPVQIAGNVVGAGALGLELLSDDFAVYDNVVVGARTATSTVPYVGINVGAAPSEGQVRGAIERNRVTNFVGGVGITVNADASHLTVRDNTIDQADGGFVMADTATADDLLLEGNQLASIGATSTTTSLENGFSGIVVVGATRAVVRGNTLTNIGTANTQGVLVTGIAVSQPSVASITDNELRGIGSSTITTGQTYGIRVLGPFGDARIVGNRVQPTVPSAAASASMVFSGISITNPRRRLYPGLSGAELDLSPQLLAGVGAVAGGAASPPAAQMMSLALSPGALAAVGGGAPTANQPPASPPAAPPAAPPTAPAATITQAGVNPVLFQLNTSASSAADASALTARKSLGAFLGDLSLTTGGDATIIASANQQSADVSGNVVDVVPSVLALIQTDVVGSCLLRGNRATLTSASSSATPTKAPGSTTPVPAVSAYATVLIASDNFVNAYAGVTGLALWGTAKATVLGNISTSGITLGGSALGAPWNTLNGG